MSGFRWGLDAGDTRSLRGRVLVVMGRLRPGGSVEQARAEMETIGERLEQSDPGLNRGWQPSVYPLRDEIVGEVRTPLLVLLSAVGGLLLMACVNVANLLLARGATRGREVAVRAAMGATRGRLVLQLLCESLLLALAGGALGLVLARGAFALLTRLGSTSIPRLAQAHLDYRILVFAFLASVATGLVFGLAPALQVSTVNPNLALTAAGRGRTGFAGGPADARWPSGLRDRPGGGPADWRRFADAQFRATAGGESGVSAGRDCLTFRLPLSGTHNATPEQRAAFLKQAIDRLAALPGGAAGQRRQYPAADGAGNGNHFRSAGKAGAAARTTAHRTGAGGGAFLLPHDRDSGGGRAGFSGHRHPAERAGGGGEPDVGAPFLAAGRSAGCQAGAGPGGPRGGDCRRGWAT